MFYFITHADQGKRRKKITQSQKEWRMLFCVNCDICRRFLSFFQITHHLLAVQDLKASLSPLSETLNFVHEFLPQKDKKVIRAAGIFSTSHCVTISCHGSFQNPNRYSGGKKRLHREGRKY